MLYTLCTPHPASEAVLEDIAQLIVKGDWSVPRSLLERLATEGSIRDRDDAQTVDSYRHWGWASQIDLAGQFGIPVERFNNDPHERSVPIPREIVEQLVGKRATRSMQIEWKDKVWVIVDGIGINAEKGRIFESEDFGRFANMVIALADRIDFDH